MKRTKTCCCCGESAGAWEQWWNRDTGFGLCQKCVDWIHKRWPSEDLNDLYGKPGIHRPAYEGEPVDA